MSAHIYRRSRLALTILLARVPLAACLLYAGDTGAAVALLFASELVLVTSIARPRPYPRPVSR